MSPSLLIHGSAAQICSFTLVNRRLLAGLRALGWRASLVGSDAPAEAPYPPLARPDVYLYYGFPFDLLDAPGRLNVFYLAYDYRTFVPRDRDLAQRLNTRFDLVLVPSRFSADVCRRNGVARPIVVCPHGFDPAEFFPPSAQALRARAGGPFEFLALGGAYERKGTDLLLRAYRRTFRRADRVRLTIKAFSYDHLLPWVRRHLAPFDRPGAPELVFEHSIAPSVAPFYRRADAGVFPYRGEAFALTVLECLASGTPVIATRGCAPLEYARDGASWIPAVRSFRAGRDGLEPDIEALGRLMREAVERGRAPLAHRRRIARSVAGWTWDRAVRRIDHTLRAHLRRAVTSVPRRAERPVSRPGKGLTVGFVFHSRGDTSWKKMARHVERALSARSTRLSPHGWRDSAFSGDADLVVGQSEHALEAFHAAVDRQPGARRVLYRESAPIRHMIAVSARERRVCGADPLKVAPLRVWRNEMEYRLADRLIVSSRASKARFIAHGIEPGRLIVVTPGIDAAPRVPRRSRGPYRVLFSASDPFRKGVRVLFDAWRQAKLPNAELVCVASRELLTAKRLLATAVALPSIQLRPYLPRRQFLALYAEVDCVVLPSFEDGFSFDVADAIARGIPCIVSNQAGIHEILTHGEDAWIVPSGRPAALAEALEAMASASRRRAIGRAGRETARQWTWSRFERSFAAAVFD